MSPKQRAAEAAMVFVKSGMVLGLGTGSTSACFLQALSAAVKAGRLRDIRGIPTSCESERRARELGIPLATLQESPHPDLTIDGTDEVDPNLDLIKGLGGALLREKILAQNCQRLIIIADASKRVDVLGTRCPLPVEVVPFGHQAQEAFLRGLGATPILRRRPDGSIFVTDNGNYIYDCRFERIGNPKALDEALIYRAGVVESGLFIGMAQLALIADENSIEERRRA
jgi:ribose 5-phosphate isomerase A